MFKKIFILFLAGGIILSSSNLLFAKTTEEELGELKKRISDLEQKLSEQEITLDKHKEVQDTLEKIKEAFNGISLGGGATFIVQGANNANGDSLTSGAEDVTDASYSIDLEFEKTFADYGMAFIHLETGDGAGVEDELQVFSNVNRDADDSDGSISLTEVWYEHYFDNLPLTLTFGKIDPTVYVDTNTLANDEGGQFLGHIFRNSPALEFPDDNAAGARIAIEPVDFLDLELLVMDANADWEDAFDNIFFSGQVNFKPKLFNRPGNYRFYSWLNDKDHLEWNNSLKTKEKGYGFGLSFDQEITDAISLFARYGWQNPEVYAADADFSLEYSWSTGIQFSGSSWGRDEDYFGVAFGQVKPSDDYKQVNGLNAKTENHLEAYYNFKVNDYLRVSPDIQIIWNPYGGDAANGDKTIFVGGIRSQIDF